MEDMCIVFPFCNWNAAQRALFAGMLMSAGPNLIDPRGRLLPRSYDLLGVVFICHTATFNFHCFDILSICTHSFGIFPLQVSIVRLYFKSLTQMLLHPLQPHCCKTMRRVSLAFVKCPFFPQNISRFKWWRNQILPHLFFFFSLHR